MKNKPAKENAKWFIAKMQLPGPITICGDGQGPYEVFIGPYRRDQILEKSSHYNYSKIEIFEVKPAVEVVEIP